MVVLIHCRFTAPTGQEDIVPFWLLESAPYGLSLSAEGPK